MAQTAIAKPVEIQFFPLDTPEHIGEAQDDLMNIGFRSTCAAWVDSRTNSKTWALECVAPNGVITTAQFGDVLVWDTIALIAMPDREFQAKYRA